MQNYSMSSGRCCKAPEMTSDRTCQTCKHWASGASYDPGFNLGLGRCQATLMFWNSTDWDEGGSRTWAPEAQNKTAFVQDGSDYSAHLYTKPEHSCTMYEHA